MSFLYAGEFLNAVEIESIVDTLDNLHSEWTRRAPKPMPIYTMGAATYLDARHNCATYKKSARQKNGILQENFDWLYSRLIEKISVQFGPAVLEPELALPGFHIFGEHRGRHHHQPQAVNAGDVVACGPAKVMMMIVEVAVCQAKIT